MSVYTTLTLKEVQAFAAPYGLEVNDLIPIQGGIQNTNYFVVNSDDKKIYIQSAYQMDTDKKESSELSSLTLTKDFFKKIIVRMDIPHNYYDQNGIYHCNLIDLLLGKIDIF